MEAAGTFTSSPIIPTTGGGGGGGGGGVDYLNQENSREGKGTNSNISAPPESAIFLRAISAACMYNFVQCHNFRLNHIRFALFFLYILTFVLTYQTCNSD